eukprot:GHUV01007404.1.p1 GENE.GHUV01007404.1~~GHUV01007404.1.p1  ORF type:complete len:353 (+),score=105.41 GHUV01007404.1:281-1339(+)
MLPALVGRLKANQRLASLLPCSSSVWGQLQQTSAGYAVAATAAAAPPAVVSASRAAAQAVVNPLVMQYPFDIEYYTPRRTVLYNLVKQPIAAIELPGDVFNVPVRIDIINEVIRWQRAKARQGTHKTKDRSEVRGGGKKPWQQKGSGRARQGSIRAPQWRGGGVVHGPKPRSYAFALNKKVRRLGLKCALSAKANEGRLIVLDSLQPDQLKTKFMYAKLQNLLQDQPRISVLVMDSDKSGEDGGLALRRTARNIPGVEIVPARGANVYSIVRRDVLVITKAAADSIVERLRRPINRLGAAGLAFQDKLQQRRQREKLLQQQQAYQQQLLTAGDELLQQHAQAAVATAAGSLA